MKSLHTASLAVAIAAALSACGGSSSDSPDTTATTDAGTQTYALTGTVPGTLIEAICDDGSFYSTHSIQDGTAQHPFSLDLPQEISCRVVMTTNEDDPANKVVTPIKLVNNGVESIAFKHRGSSLDLGYVDLPLSRAAMPLDLNGDGVADAPMAVEVAADHAQDVELSSLSNDPLDKDGDGIVNIYEDDDGDLIPNIDDPDDDNDGIPDIDDHDADNDGQNDNDLDRDGIPNGEDADDDNDGIHDSKDTDDDNDGLLDTEDNDDDNDGTPDSEDDDNHSSSNDSDDNDVNASGDSSTARNDDDDDDDHGSDNDDQGGYTGNTGTTTPVTTPAAAGPSAGRLLAAQCSQCHGPDGHSLNGIDSIAGESVAEIMEEMLEMQAETKRDIMVHQAKGYTTEQIRLIAEYLASVSGGGYGGGDSDHDDDDEEDDDDD